MLITWLQYYLCSSVSMSCLCIKFGLISVAIMKWIVVLVVLERTAVVVANINFTYTKEMASVCKTHICRYGYSYDTYYRIDANKWTPSDPANIALEMHIAIQASSNGHILLSPVYRPSKTDSVYEIVVGGGANTFTELRRNLRRNSKTSSKTIGVLSKNELRGFYIRLSKGGLLEFGAEGDELPIISFLDIDPLDIKYFSFAAWTGVEAKFLYDCPAPGSETKGNSIIERNSKEVEPKLSPSDQLKRIMLLGRMPSLAPSSNMTVQLGVMVTSMRFDAFDSKVTTGLAIVASWTDSSMAWNPDKFNGVTRVSFRQGQIWRPTFLVYNSNSIDVLDANYAGLITMDNSGEATFHFRSTVETWCVTYDDSWNKWPFDEYTCSIIIQPWESHEMISLELLNPNDNKLKIFADIDRTIKNEWNVRWTELLVTPYHWQKLYPFTSNDTNQSDRFVVHLMFKRGAVSYNIAFYTPLVVLVTFLLMSFWSEPLKMSRVWFYAGCTIVICTGLCFIDYIMPCHTVPSLLILYITVLGGVLFALLLQVFLMTTFSKTICATQPIQSVLTAALFRTIFFLPPMKVAKNYSTLNEAYQEDDDSGVIITPRNSNVEEMEADTNVSYGGTTELAEVFDKLLFFVYSLTFAIMLALHF